MENDIDPWVNRFTSVRRNATKKLESQEEYQETEYDRKIREEEKAEEAARKGEVTLNNTKDAKSKDKSGEKSKDGKANPKDVKKGEKATEGEKKEEDKKEEAKESADKPKQEEKR